jgi:hypothetical protein
VQSSLNKQECEAVLDKLLEWKAVPVSCLNKVKRELKDPEKCNKFLSDFSKSPLRELLDARALVSEEMWAGYKWMQMNGLQEQVIFYAARRKMNDWFKARYPRPAKGIPNVDAQTDGANIMIAEWNALQRV